MPTLKTTRRMLEFIRGSILVNEEPPTLKEIGEQFNMRSPASVHKHLVKMESLGWIKRKRYKLRGIEVIEQEKSEAA